MSDQTRTIVLELNELCPPLLDQFMAEGHLPNFKKLHDSADVFITCTDDENLEPWVQWVSLHTGKPQKIHGIAQLDEGHKIDQPALWDMLAAADRSSLVFGTMNASSVTSDLITMVPDPWSRHIGASTTEFSPFHRFISAQVAEHTNPDATLSLKDTVEFGRFLLSHGLSAHTVFAAIRQLTSEKFSAHDVRWKRACILDEIQWDVFSHLMRRNHPDVAFFFSNSVAYFQHRFWRHMSPDSYRVKPSAEDLAAYGDAILHGYRQMDRYVARAMTLVGEGGKVILATALSQEANLRYEAIGGKFVYRPRNFDRFVNWACGDGGPEGITFEPVMTHQSWATCRSVTEAQRCAEALRNVITKDTGQPVMLVHNPQENRVFFSCAFISKVDEDLEIVQAENGQVARFSDFFSLVGQVNNSQHNRNGALWIQRDDRCGMVHPGKVDLPEAARYLIDAFGLDGAATLGLADRDSPYADRVPA